MESHDVSSAQKHDKDSCLYQGRVYSENEQICGEGICIVCKNGDWEETEQGLSYMMF